MLLSLVAMLMMEGSVQLKLVTEFFLDKKTNISLMVVESMFGCTMFKQLFYQFKLACCSRRALEMKFSGPRVLPPIGCLLSSVTW